MLSELKPRPPINPAARGYGAIYHEGQVNHCPGCGMTHWYIGLSTAECAFCFTAPGVEGVARCAQGHRALPR